MSLLVHGFATTEDDKRSYPFMALLDSGCTLSAIDKGYVQKHKLRTFKYDNPIRLFLSDGSEPKSGQITDFVEMQIQIGNHQEFIHLAILDLTKMDIFLGYDWLKLHNPEIDWTKNEIGFTRCLSGCGQPHVIRTTSFETVVWQQPSWFRVYMTKSTQLVLEATKGQKDKTFEELVLERYRKFQDVFEPMAFDELPARKPWDHAINLKPYAPDHLDCKLYPMPPEERRNSMNSSKKTYEQDESNHRNLPSLLHSFLLRRKTPTTSDRYKIIENSMRSPLTISIHCL
jgi:hypothetical protein